MDSMIPCRRVYPKVGSDDRGEPGAYIGEKPFELNNAEILCFLVGVEDV